MSAPSPRKQEEASHSNFIRQIIEADLMAGKYATRKWNGKPGSALSLHRAPPDPAKIRTRFPPEPNGYLHYGHAKSIFLNFGLAREYGGACHLRFDDTNPTKEETEYVDSIRDSVKWLGFSWEDPGGNTNEYYASDYFEYLYQFAEELVRRGHAYVDSLSPEQMRALRGTLTEPGKNSPYRERGVEENLKLFREMHLGKFADGEHVLRAKIDMASPNMNMRDPAMYRIRHAAHHRTGDHWCIYPTYDWAHGVSDALENITHSLCTLEFEDHRPLYEWFNERLAEDWTGYDGVKRPGLLQRPLPRQIEFARLNLTCVVLSKRKLIQLVEERHVDGWDDPRMPTLVGARRRGFTPEGFRVFTERIGVAKADSWIDFSVLEDCMREHLNEVAPRRIAVLDPVKLVIENYPPGQEEECEAPNHPQKPEWGRRKLPLSRELWIEREDFSENPPKGYFRLFPGNKVRRQGDRHRALHLRSRHAVRDARRGEGQGQGQHPLGEREGLVFRGSAAVRPAVQGDASRSGRQRARAGPESGFEESRHRPARAGAQGRTARGAVPVRAPRLFRRRSHRFEARLTSIQPVRHPERFVEQVAACPLHRRRLSWGCHASNVARTRHPKPCQISVLAFPAIAAVA